MKKETNKQIIENLTKEVISLKEEITEWKNICENLNKELLLISENTDKEFQASGEYIQMKKKIRELELKNNTLVELINHEKKKNELFENNRNIRGAGRKPKFNEQEKEMILMYRIQGYSIQQLADTYNCSVGLIHSIIKDFENEK